MDTIFANVAIVGPHINDLLVVSETEDYHMYDLELVFQVNLDNN